MVYVGIYPLYSPTFPFDLKQIHKDGCWLRSNFRSVGSTTSKRMGSATWFCRDGEGMKSCRLYGDELNQVPEVSFKYDVDLEPPKAKQVYIVYMTLHPYLVSLFWFQPASQFGRPVGFGKFGRPACVGKSGRRPVWDNLAGRRVLKKRKRD